MPVTSTQIDECSVFSYPAPTFSPSAAEVISKKLDWLTVEGISTVDCCPDVVHCTLPNGIKIENRVRFNGESMNGIYATKFYKAHTIIFKEKLHLIRPKDGDFKLIVDPDGTEYHMNGYIHIPYRSIDIAVLGTFSLFINHSCDPNCLIIDAEDRSESVFIALRDIQPNDEITVDYCLAEYDVKGKNIRI
ncbi:unnamed protein product [Adineta ricciae]|uniref:SET domain-containing protein n=1 Tax=Adineta ricciae TaxID=249248 RepID=A0A816BMK4_ADIRI|nr:unnamed protein product [Adineta ricciae]CAF1609637.1 unnamed protein product [Adineta ricciae]